MTGHARPAIHLVTDRHQLSPSARTIDEELSALEAFLDEAIDAAVDVVQLREPGVGAARLASLVARVVRRARGSATRVLVNDRIDVAAAAAADGVHLKSDGPSLARVRSIDATWTIGRSIHVGDAPECGDVDYAMFGTVYSSASKGSSSPVAGLDALARVARHTPRPVIAIGGITPTRVPAVLAAGAAGVAGIGVFLPPGRAPGSLGVRRAVDALRAAWTA